MGKYFNVNGACFPDEHYMVDLSGRLEKIRKLVDDGKYFVINRARQYGKTTTLWALGEYLRDDYIVFSLSFQRMSSAVFQDEYAFSREFARMILRAVHNRRRKIDGLSEEDIRALETGALSGSMNLADLFYLLSGLCETAARPVVLMIDEVDNASNNQVFLDFLGLLRSCYLDRKQYAAFHSVILAGVYDIKNLRRKIRPEEEHRYNSPWNARADNEENESLLSFDECPRHHRETKSPYDVAADFDVDMSFCPEDIRGMLHGYEADHRTGMDCADIASLIYDYTSGYPFLVSRICKLTDEKIADSDDFEGKSAAWTKNGVMEAIKMLLAESNTLFESLTGKLTDYPDLKKLLYTLLFTGSSIPYNSLNDSLRVAEMFGFVKNQNGNVAISNRIFETILYNLFLSEEALDSELHRTGVLEKNQFVRNGRLDMEPVLKRFVVHFHELYGDQEERFLEDAGRKYFLLYLRPIINGVGNYYIESRTRNLERTDVVVDYRGEQFVIELKIWRGNAYNERGERQLAEYMDYYHLKKGYMLSFNFNKKKEIGVKEIRFEDRVLVEAVV